MRPHRETTRYPATKQNTYILLSRGYRVHSSDVQTFFFKVRNVFCIKIQYVHIPERIPKQFFTRFNTNKTRKLIANLTLAKCSLIAPSLLSAFDENYYSMLKEYYDLHAKMYALQNLLHTCARSHIQELLSRVVCT